jgi:hypothetical protein
MVGIGHHDDARAWNCVRRWRAHRAGRARVVRAGEDQHGDIRADRVRRLRQPDPIALPAGTAPHSIAVADVNLDPRATAQSHAMLGGVSNAADELVALAERELRGIADARRAAAYILEYAADPEAFDDPELPFSSGFHAALAVLQRAGDKHAGDELRREALPALRAIFDERYGRWKNASDRSELVEAADDLLFALKIFAIYGGQEQHDRIIAAVRDGLDPEGFMWSMVFGELATAGERTLPVFQAIARPLPEGFIAVALLDGANRMAIAVRLAAHPFDFGDGHARLRAWLTHPKPENASYASSATVALPFVTDRAIREELFSLADRHADASVRVEAAWARARAGDDSGIDALARFATEPRTSSMAVRYLDELGRADAIPSAAADPTFRAMAECIEWLAHPSEMADRRTRSISTIIAPRSGRRRTTSAPSGSSATRIAMTSTGEASSCTDR